MHPSESVQIDLPHNVLQLIQKKIDMGIFNCPKDAVMQALSDWEQQESDKIIRLQNIKNRLYEASNNTRASRPIDDVFSDVEQYIDTI